MAPGETSGGRGLHQPALPPRAVSAQVGAHAAAGGHTGGEPSILGLLNGPKVGETSDGNEVLFGGLNGLGENGQSTFEVADGEPPLRLHGFTLLMPGILGKLLRLGALEVVQGMSVDDLAKVPAAERWTAAGGRVSSLFEASAALSGDVQRRKWYSRMLGLDIQTRRRRAAREPSVGLQGGGPARPLEQTVPVRRRRAGGGLRRCLPLLVVRPPCPPLPPSRGHPFSLLSMLPQLPRARSRRALRQAVPTEEISCPQRVKVPMTMSSSSASSSESSPLPADVGPPPSSECRAPSRPALSCTSRGVQLLRRAVAGSPVSRPLSDATARRLAPAPL
ncbi:unnamed protein product [Prorocentrum cordatum]|uniref:Uncharacterized protein n=1 Tax=Prorocentrum cordatum TaxID=2364126 RepID=A0ABN9TN99_9DINO|nr:unnamed protein product [Polarella glacialis]